MHAKKSLGQHFLTSQKAIHDMVQGANVGQGELIVEIGPGKGVLTRALLERGAHVIAIEKDRDLIPLLNESFTVEIENKQLTLIEDDVLAWTPPRNPYKLVANIPYYITGAILEKFLSSTFQPNTLTVLIQKEVAERIVAKDGKESVLSIAVASYGAPRIVSKVPKGAFVPAPKVDSAVLTVEHISRDFFLDCDETVFFGVVKAMFGKKRKQIGGSLGDYLKNKDLAKHVLATLSIDPRTRPEDIHLGTWKLLAQHVAGSVQ